MNGETFSGLLRRNAESGTTEGLRFMGLDGQQEAYSWPEIYERAQCVAGGLRERGIRPGERVSLVIPTNITFFDAFFGIQLCGAVPVPLYPPVRLGRLDEYHQRTAAMLRAVSARLVLSDGRTWRILGESVRLAGTELGAQLVDSVRSSPYFHESRPTDLGLIQFSSGTTVNPKPVALTHRNLTSNVRAILSLIVPKLDPELNRATGVTWLPLYHDMGLVGCVGPALVYPGSLFLIAPEQFLARPALWLRTLSQSRALVSPAPNFAYSYCVDRIRDEEMTGVDLSGWAWALNGAEPVAPETLRRFSERFSRWGFRPEALTPVYGLAEATLAVSFSEHGKGLQTSRFSRDALASARVEPAPDGVELVSVGRPLPGEEVRVDSEGLGAVQVRGPSVMSGYYNRPDLDAAALVDGWLNTGDLGFFHDGELYITGRFKDVLLLRGKNHAPHEVEQAGDQVAGVRRGCIAAVSYRPEGLEHEQLWVIAEIVEGADPALVGPALIAEILAVTALKVERLELVPPGTLPRTSSGKIRRSESLARLLAGTLKPPGAVNVLTIGAAMLRGTLGHWQNRRDGR